MEIFTNPNYSKKTDSKYNFGGSGALNNNSQLKREIKDRINESENKTVSFVVMALFVTFIVMSIAYIVGFCAVVQNHIYQNNKIDNLLIPLIQSFEARVSPGLDNTESFEQLKACLLEKNHKECLDPGK